jgi:hypothetical protein
MRTFADSTLLCENSPIRKMNTDEY